ncbi:hypothetical protein Tco_0838951 [Tanacetum coccineum]|uniref:Uncharacterized protein n=1 Tax=Tanacetum coccineum TaxID=301880 RepID=A0ABQ5AR28_9ASTR
MVTPDRALRLRSTGVGGVTIPGVGVAPWRWYRRCSTNARCDEEERGKEEEESVLLLKVVKVVEVDAIEDVKE